MINEWSVIVCKNCCIPLVIKRNFLNNFAAFDSPSGVEENSPRFWAIIIRFIRKINLLNELFDFEILIRIKCPFTIEKLYTN